MTTCNICGKPLTDPVSVARGIGPECIINYKNDSRGQGNLFSMRARYRYGIEGDILWLIDEGAGKPLTNDMENALSDISETEGGLDGMKIMYRDDFGTWDGVRVLRGERVEFFPIGETSFRKAVEKLRTK